MHGRLKVKTTAEKAAEKEIKRAEKIKIYNGCMARIRGLYTDKVYGDEILELIKGILEKIPEYSTLWNWRREVLTTLLTDENKGKMLENERQFVAKCLELNPKAYSLWSHRRWCVELEPTEERCFAELDLCNLFLKFDERNFHCWDYRRFITKLGGISDEKELNKSQKLIESNFSNYSAWHYRSTLLKCTTEVITKELDWAQNGYFTDPSDQSVWLYHQWLLGRTEMKYSMLAACVNYIDEECVLSVLLCKPSYEQPQLQVLVNKETLDPIHWTSSTRPSRLWSTHLTETDNVTLVVEEAVLMLGRDVRVVLGRDVRVVSGRDVRVVSVMLGRDVRVVSVVPDLTTRAVFSAPVDTVSEQLVNIRQLLDLEPDNKWCLLTLVNMLNNNTQYKSKEQISELRTLTVKLCEVDSMRSGYYKDLWSKILCQAGLDSWWNSPSHTKSLNLNKKYLSCLKHLDYMFALQSLDLSHNNITSLNGFQSMISLNKLNISHNKLMSLEGIERCKLLEDLDVSDNDIMSSMGLLPGVNCRIRRLNLVNNPVTTMSVYPACVVDAWVMLCVLDGSEL